MKTTLGLTRTCLSWSRIMTDLDIVMNWKQAIYYGHECMWWSNKLIPLDLELTMSHVLNTD